MISVKVNEPVVVANTLPLVNPTMRTLSFCGEMAIVLMGMATPVEVMIGAWLTTTLLVPPSAERYRRSLPK